MKKNNGFTLVELTVVMVLIALIMTIAIPSVLKLSKNVKVGAYTTKIGLIEAGAKDYGTSNVNAIANADMGCSFTEDGGITVESVFSTLPYRCKRMTVEDLVKSGKLQYDEKNVCESKDSNCSAQYQNNVVINPVTNYVINKCFVYVYYKNSRVYAKFDKISCDMQLDSIPVNETFYGKEYIPAKGK